MQKQKVVITGVLDSECLQTLLDDQRLNTIYKPDCKRAELLKLVGDARVLITRSETAVDRELLAAAHDLKIVARAAVGVNNIDLDFATERGILVINTPGKNTNSAAELAFGLLLCMMRNLPQAWQEIQRRGWDRHRFTGRELRGKRIGIVGLGNVGHRVAKFAHGFDMEVFGFDPYLAQHLFVRYDVVACSSLLELAQTVDILSLHVPLNHETTGMVDAQILNALPRGSLLINAARGGIIAETDLVAALESGHLAGAGIDTWETEPEPLAKLAQHPKVWGTPHIGASTLEAQRAIGLSVVEQVRKALDGYVVDHPVNLPHIGVIDHPIVKPYTVLAEKLSSFAAQILRFNVTKVEVAYRGDLAEVDHGLIRLGLMKGYAAHAANSFVSYVNAQHHFERLGLHLEESTDPDFSNYRSALKVSFSDDSGRRLILGGIVFDQQYLRLSLINGFCFEVEPTGNFLVLTNRDKPGVIGSVGGVLGKNSVNIDSFSLSRLEQGGDAMALIKVDSEPSQVVLDELLTNPNVLEVSLVRL